MGKFNNLMFNQVNIKIGKYCPACGAYNMFGADATEMAYVGAKIHCKDCGGIFHIIEDEESEIDDEKL